MGNNYEYEAYICYNKISISILNYEYKMSLLKTTVSFKLSLKNHNPQQWKCAISLDYPPYGESRIYKTRYYLLGNEEVIVSYDLKFKGSKMRLVLHPGDHVSGNTYPVIYINLGKKPTFEDEDERYSERFWQLGYRTCD